MSARGIGLSLAAAATLAAGAARADFAPREPWENEPATRRSGLVIGIAAGFGASSLAGFPNDPAKIGYVSAYTATGVKATTVGALFVGGALADWVNFQLGFGGNYMMGLPSGQSATVGAFLFHVEFFPAFAVGRWWRDVGVFVDAGTGPVKLQVSGQDVPLIEGGAGALLGGGVFWEGLRGWHFGNGPFVSANYMWSDSVRRPAFFLGWRTALYTGTFAK